MRCPSSIEDEAGRLAALAEYGLSAAVGLPSLEPIVDIAVRMFDVPAAAVNMIGSDHVFFAASAGIGECDMRRDVSFCAHAITQDEVLVIEDAQLDPRFHDNPLVAQGLIRFYAGVPLRAPSGHALGALCVVDSRPHAQFDERDRVRLKDLARLATDKLELRRLERAAELRPSHFEASAATSPNAVICFDADARITAWNAAAAEMFGYVAADVLHRPLDMLMIEDDRVRVHAGIDRVLGGDAPARAASALTGVRRDGEQFPVELHWSAWQEGPFVHFGAIVRDMTQDRREKEALYRLANYDSLTGLPNRNLLHRRAAEALESDPPPAMIMIDLDGFKDVNDTLGHAVGDAILQAVGKRLIETVPPTSTVARIGGDEFAVLLVGNDDPLSVAEVAQDIIAAVAAPILVDGHEVRVAGSCGLAIAPGHGDMVEELMSSADLALFQAKTGGRGRFFLFIPALRAEAVARRMYDAELHRAVERGEFVLFYQPQVRLRDGVLTGAEALIRWQHPVRGLLQPAAFMPALEGGPLASTVGNWVIMAACAQAAKWRRVHPDFRMSVNLSAAQFRADGIATVVAQALAAHMLPPAALELEITENIVLDQEDLVLPQLHEVRELGVTLSFDDFGTGYASLNMLKSYPISHIKIDKSFTQAVQTSAHDRAIVASLLDLTQQLGIKVIAEGVENEEQRIFLATRGCDEGQGYLFGRPVPADVFAEQFWPGEGIRMGRRR